MHALRAVQLTAEIHHVRPVDLLDLYDGQPFRAEHVDHPSGIADAGPLRGVEIILVHIFEILLLDVDDQQSAFFLDVHKSDSFPVHMLKNSASASVFNGLTTESPTPGFLPGGGKPLRQSCGRLRRIFSKCSCYIIPRPSR